MHDHLTNLIGDDDPIDVVQLEDEPCEPGDVQEVRLVGALALIDGDETDYKTICRRGKAHRRRV